MIFDGEFFTIVSDGWFLCIRILPTKKNRENHLVFALLVLDEGPLEFHKKIK